MNYKYNRHSFSAGVTVSLPTEFEKVYTVSVPEGYQLEGLQIFTPDIASEILDLPFRCDIEVVDKEILFLLEYQDFVSTKDLGRLGKQVEGAKKIIALLKPKFDSLTWSPVGDKSYHM